MSTWSLGNKEQLITWIKNQQESLQTVPGDDPTGEDEKAAARMQYGFDMEPNAVIPHGDQDC